VTPNRLGGCLRHAPPLLAYAAITILLTWPLAREMGELVPSDLADPLISAYILWWNAQQVPFTDAWWHGRFFFPSPGSLALSDHRVGIGLFATPLIWLGASPLDTYAITFLLTYFLSAAAAYALGWTLTGSRGAAFVAGCIFGFNPFRAGHLAHLELLAAYCLPIILVTLHRWLATGQHRWLLALSAALLLQALTGGYYFFYMAVLVALWLVWFVRGRPRRDLAYLALALAVPLIAIAPVLARYREVHQAMGLSRSIREIQHYSADLIGLVSAPVSLALWNTPESWQTPEGALMPGSVAVLLVAGVGVRSLRRRIAANAAAAVPRLRRVLLAIAIAAMTVALLPLVFGPLAVDLGGLQVSTSGQHKPLSIAFACLVIWLATSAPLRAAFAARSAFAFYVLAMAVMWLCAFGPEVRLLGSRVLYKPPYAWLMLLPGFRDEFRVPARFAMLAVLALSAAAAIAIVRLTTHWSYRSRLVAVGAIAMAILAESWIYPFPMVAAPTRLEVPAAVPASAVVLELPVNLNEDALAMFHGTTHHRASVNGLSGYSPPHYNLFVRALEEGNVAVLTAFRRHTDLAVFSRRDDATAVQLMTRIRDGSGAVALAATASHDVVLLRMQPMEHASMAPPAAEEAAITEMTSHAGADTLSRLFDADYQTAWITDTPQKGDEFISVVLREARMISGVRLALGGYLSEFPRGIAIDVSLDGKQWAEAWTGDGALTAVEAALQDQKNVEMVIAFEPRRANYVRVRQTGQSADVWALAELRILAEPTTPRP
jgi:hypothetical protein